MGFHTLVYFITQTLVHLGDTHKRAVRVESVETEDWLKAGHRVEPDNGMHFWAIAVGNVEIKSMKSVCLVALSFLLFVGRVFPLEAICESIATL